MGSRFAKAVRDMDIDEISIVDRPAAQHAAIMISKSLGAEMDYFTADGTPLEFDEDGIVIGIAPDTKIFGADGLEYELNQEAIDLLTAEAEEAANANQLVGAGAGDGQVAKKFGGRTAPAARTSVTKSLSEQLSEEISKAVGDDATRSVLTKALDMISKGDAEREALAKAFRAEQDIRLTAEYVEIAKSYGALPVSADELGPVLKRAAESLSDADCAVLNKVFDATGTILFEELGYQGGGTEDGSDPMAVVEAALAAGQVQKNADGSVTEISKAHAVETYFSDHPKAYDDYINSKGRG